MTKLYISYYGNQISIMEASYNKKKDKYKILKSEIIILESNDKVFTLDEKIKLIKDKFKKNKFKSKIAIVNLATPDIICKTVSIPKVNTKDLEGILRNGIDEFIHVDSFNNEYSYEVINEKEYEGKLFLNIAIGGVSKTVLNEIVEIIKSLKVKIEAVDILPISLSRVVNKFKDDSIVLVNSGKYGTIISIYKEGNLFTYEYLKIKLDKSKGYDYYNMMKILEEIKGIITYYSSRNFGKNVDKIILIGEITNHYNVKEEFQKLFNTEVLLGFDDLYDIDNKNLYIDNLGILKRENNNSEYPYIDISPTYLKDYRLKNKKIKKLTLVAFIIVIISLIPYIISDMILNKANTELNSLKEELSLYDGEILNVEKLKKDIELKKQELQQYQMLFNNEITWSNILKSIDDKVPQNLEITSMDVIYEDKETQENDKNESDNNILEDVLEDVQDNYISNNEEESNDKKPIYKQIPNKINLTGNAKKSELVGQFVYELSKNEYFRDVNLIQVKDKSSEEFKSYQFEISIDLKAEVVKVEQD